MTGDVTIREIQDADWPRIFALEAQAYAASALSEADAALMSKARVAPSTCFVLNVGQEVAGYLLSLPYPLLRYPALSQPEQAVHRSRNLHLHDLVIGARFRGRGLATRLVHRLTSDARSDGYRWISLIAVAGSNAFWLTHGYRPRPEVDLPETYGADAVYMSRLV